MNAQPSNSIDLSNTTATLMAALDARSRDIVERRYGLVTGEAETLESIGRHYSITRERVRQIQAQAKKVLLDQADHYAGVARVLADIFQQHGGIMAEEHAVEVMRERVGAPDLFGSQVVFYLDLLPVYKYATRDRFFGPHWRDESIVQGDAVATVTAAGEKFLREAQHPVTTEALLAAMTRNGAVTVPELHLYTQLRASKRIQPTAFGEWGLVEWPETRPRGVGDKAYAVLRRHGRPEHFTRITELINEAEFDHKRANPQTVHNELIKDERFVLVGRGLYGLAEWGYMSGTVADVIESIMVQAKRPLSREEVIEGVLEQRKVKKNTILLGLQNQERFVRLPENRYTLKQLTQQAERA